MVTFPVSTADALQDLLAECAVPATVAGFTANPLIRHTIKDVSQIDAFIDALKLDESAVDTSLFSAGRSSLRHGIGSCFDRIQASPAPQMVLTEPTSAKPKMTATEFMPLKQQFLRSYPGELLHEGNTPSLIFLRKVRDMQEPNVFQWIPWRARVSEAAASQFAKTRPPRTDRRLLQSLMQSEDLGMNLLSPSNPSTFRDPWSFVCPNTKACLQLR